MSVWGWLQRALRGAAERRVEAEPLPHVVIARSPPPLTPEQLVRAVPGMTPERAALWCPAIVAIVPEAKLGPVRRMAMFLAQTGHETASFTRLRESLDYAPERLRAVWPSRFTDQEARELGRAEGKPADQRAIAERVYGGRLGNLYPGDAWRFRGGGPAQLTGRANYQACADALGMDIDTLARRIDEPEIGMRSAAWFWRSRPEIEAAADRGDVTAVTRLWNGGLHGLADRSARYVRALEALEQG